MGLATESCVFQSRCWKESHAGGGSPKPTFRALPSPSSPWALLMLVIFLISCVSADCNLWSIRLAVAAPSDIADDLSTVILKGILSAGSPGCHIKGLSGGRHRLQPQPTRRNSSRSSASQALWSGIGNPVPELSREPRTGFLFGFRQLLAEDDQLY